MYLLKKLYRKIRSNGVVNYTKGTIQQVVYLNMIWFSTYLAFFIHTIVQIIYANKTFIYAWPILLLIHSLFGMVLLLVKYGKLHLAKHFFLLITNSCVIFLDLLYGHESHMYLFLFAFLPSAFNLFDYKKQFKQIIVYISIPIVYEFLRFTLIGENYIIYNNGNVETNKAIYIASVTLSYCMFIAFAGYMVLNNIKKQYKLNMQALNLQTTIDNIPASVWSVNTKYQILAKNKNYDQSIVDLFGVEGPSKGKSITEHKLWSKIPDDFKKHYVSVFNNQTVNQEYHLDDKYYDIKGMPITQADGTVVGASFVSINITERKKNENALLHAKLKAENAEKAKGQFLSNMSHELRTPLNGIIGISHLLQTEKHLDNQVSNLNVLKSISDHMLSLVNNVLDYSKIEAGKIELNPNRLNLYSLKQKTVSTFSSLFEEKNVQFDFIVDEKLKTVDVYFDELRLQQVLNNLISNAFKFTSQGNVTVSISLQKSNQSKVVALFSVVDTGCGILKDKLDRIFDSFTQADADTTRKFGGTGLGLSISNNLVKLMDSKIQVTSEPEQGSNFYFELDMPLYSKSTQNIKTPEKAFSFDELQNCRVLLAEDNLINMQVAKKIISKWGAKITEAKNGKEAYEKATENEFDIMLIDLDMPIMDGKTAVAAIRNHNIKTPIIAFTAALYENMHSELVQKGFNDFVIKPFSPDELYMKMLVTIQRN